MFAQIMSNLVMISILTILNSFLLVHYIIPKIIWVIVSRKLNVEPNERSSHKTSTPSMAGIAFFVTLIMTMFFVQYFDTEQIGLNLIASTTLIFMVGVKDDLVVSTPRAKLIMEILAVLFLFFHSSMEVTSLHGFLGIYEIPMVISYIGVVILILTIINAFNLIDGIDGLASVIAIIIFSVFALIFFSADLYFYFLVCLSFIGMLSAYLYYNFSNTQKIFMGDTGSLLIGFCIGFCTLKFLAMDPLLFSHFTFQAENELIIVASILCIPLFDMVRVIGVRLLKGKSPFNPDRNHTHHILIDSGRSHFQATMILGAINYGFVIAMIWFSSYFNSFQMLCMLLTAFGLFLITFYWLKKRFLNEKEKLSQFKTEK